MKFAVLLAAFVVELNFCRTAAADKMEDETFESAVRLARNNCA